MGRSEEHMKKSEKIELRVDHTEKERLSNIAERRGQTVSDVVRDALAVELGAAPQAYPKWPGFVAICALALAGVSLLWLASGHQTGTRERPVMTTASLMLPDMRDPVLRTQVPHRNGFSQTYSINTDTGRFQFTHDVSEIGSNIFELKASLCKMFEETCAPEGESTLILSSPSDPPRFGQMVVRQAEWVVDENNVVFFVDTLGPSIKMKEAEAP